SDPGEPRTLRPWLSHEHWFEACATRRTVENRLARRSVHPRERGLLRARRFRCGEDDRGGATRRAHAGHELRADRPVAERSRKVASAYRRGGRHEGRRWRPRWWRPGWWRLWLRWR